eukprot:1769356-Prymnesium_polylepis.2
MGTYGKHTRATIARTRATCRSASRPVPRSADRRERRLVDCVSSTRTSCQPRHRGARVAPDSATTRIRNKTLC